VIPFPVSGGSYAGRMPRPKRKQTFSEKLECWMPNRTTEFSVGISVHSEVIEPQELAFVAGAFDERWEPPKISGLRYPKPRPGSRFDIHLVDDSTAAASTNVRFACETSDGPVITRLWELDPDVKVGVHAFHYLSDVGSFEPIELSAAAVSALASPTLRMDWFDIDQSGAGGHPIARSLLDPLISRRVGRRTRHSLVLQVGRSEVARFEPAKDPDGDDGDTLVGQVRGWLASNALPVGATFVAKQIIRVPGDQGIGLGFEQALFTVLAENDLGFELRTETRFNPRSWQS